MEVLSRKQCRSRQWDREGFTHRRQLIVVRSCNVPLTYL